MVTAAQEASLPVVVSITRAGQRLFHAALAGTSPDNDDWVERKSRVVHRFGHSSLYMGTKARAAASTFEARTGLDPGRYAAHGGSFPVIVRRVGVVGSVTVSGLPQLEDHRFVVEQLTLFLANRTGESTVALPESRRSLTGLFLGPRRLVAPGHGQFR